MAYTNAWTTTNPQGSALASTADDEIRKLRLDMEERITDLLDVVSFSADPLVASRLTIPDALSTTETHVRYLSHAAFHIVPTVGTGFVYDPEGGLPGFNDGLTSEVVQTNYNYISNVGKGGSFNIAYLISDINVPLGATITAIDVNFYRENATTQVSVGITKQDAAAFGTVTKPVNETSSGTTTGSMQTHSVAAGLPLTISSGFYWTWSITLNPTGGVAGPRFYGVKVTYTTPDARTRF